MLTFVLFGSALPVDRFEISRACFFWNSACVGLHQLLFWREHCPTAKVWPIYYNWMSQVFDEQSSLWQNSKDCQPYLNSDICFLYSSLVVHLWVSRIIPHTCTAVYILTDSWGPLEISLHSFILSSIPHLVATSESITPISASIALHLGSSFSLNEV